MSLEQALQLARASRPQAEADFFEELRIPSVSTLPEHREDILYNCSWLADRFRSLGMETSIEDVVPAGHPVLKADWRAASNRPPPLPTHHPPPTHPPHP